MALETKFNLIKNRDLFKKTTSQYTIIDMKIKLCSSICS